MKSRVLFVDDEQKVLDGLRRMLRRKRNEWDMVFVSSAREALGVMDQEPFRVIVSDMRMPEMDGAQLLWEVRKRHPGTVRLILSGYVEGESVLRTVGPAHQFLTKPCDSETLTNAIDNAVQLRELLQSEEIKTVLAGLHTLPTPSGIYFELMEEIKAPYSSARSVAKIIERDAAMMAETLKLTNSAYFTLSSRVTSPLQAVQLLGFEILQALIVKVGIFSQFSDSGGFGAVVEAFGRQANKIAQLARIIARVENLKPYVVEQAYCAGMLCEVGSLALVDNYRTRYKEVVSLSRSQGLSVTEAEQQVFGCTQASIGAYLLGLWGFNDPIVEAVAYQSSPRACAHHGEINALTAVHAARALVIARQARKNGADDPSSELDLDRVYLAEVGAAEHLPLWLETIESQAAECG
jgi:HD-like signal output (HDOD) protein